ADPRKGFADAASLPVGGGAGEASGAEPPNPSFRVGGSAWLVWNTLSVRSARAFRSRTAHVPAGRYPDGVGRMNPTLRGFLIIAVVAAVIVALRLEATLTALFIVARIAFLLAIAFFVYLVWRERRSEISTWSSRARAVFYGGALLVVADIAAISFAHRSGLDSVVFVFVLAAAGFAMWRTWRDQHTYS